MRSLVSAGGVSGCNPDQEGQLPGVIDARLGSIQPNFAT
jgi:hypothetical protein